MSLYRRPIPADDYPWRRQKEKQKGGEKDGGERNVLLIIFGWLPLVDAPLADEHDVHDVHFPSFT